MGGYDYKLSLANSVKQCCEADPYWIFLYSDGSVFAICENDLKNPTYQLDVEKVINIKTQESFTPTQIFGD